MPPWHRLPLALVIHCLLSLTTVSTSSTSKRAYETYDYYVLEHEGSETSLQAAADALGIEIVEQVGQLVNHWLVRASRPPDNIAARDSVVVRYENLQGRDFEGGSISLTPQIPRRRTKRAPPPPSGERVIAANLGIEDPSFPEQWHLINDDFTEHSMNVTGVWEMGYTGQGVISSLLDDGLDYTSKDLADNFDADNSHDYNDHEDLPTPKLFDDTHGTRCAGQIAAVRNDVCGVGIAYESRVAAVRILSGLLTDADEAAALNYGYQNVSVYSCSWGPPDDGKTMEAPSYLIKKAILNGINQGRGGKGSIFVFASGNGARSGDQCNFDGYTNSIYSVTVSAVDYKGLHPPYSEPCAANMIVAYSSGSGKAIVTTDKGEDRCTSGHGGTSAAAPNASGVFVLAVQARPDLTWRDIQYLCINTARMINPEDPDWEQTASGRLYSYKYGYGALDAWRFITAAKDWELVKPQAWLKTHAPQLGNGTMTSEGEYSGGEFITAEGVTSSVTITDDMLRENNFETLEHINVKVWISHAQRGDVEVEIVSPNGIKSVLAAQRKMDKDADGFPGWTFMSVKHWGENPVGDWTIRVKDAVSPETNGSFLGWNMMLWGSCIDPAAATLYELPPDDDVFPPLDDPPAATPASTSTKIYSKPTDHLPDDHGEAEGENSNPAFSASPTPSSSPYPGWIPGMGSLVKDQKWLFGAIGAVVLFGIGVGIFFWRRRVNRRKALYSTIPEGEDVSMSSLHHGRASARHGAKELYDAFGEVSDDEEETLLRGHPESSGQGFHSGFLDDEEERSADERYRDEPSDGRHSLEQNTTPRPGDDGPSSPGSGDGSWVHTS